MLHPGANSSSTMYFTNTMAIDFDKAKPSEIKTLLSFKKLVFIGQFQTYKSTVIKRIKEVASVNRFFLVN